MAQVAIIDYSMGNLHSVANALKTVAPNQDVVITSDAQVIANADRVVFPGVGAIRDCMSEIVRLGVDEIVKKAIAEKPVLAICVGMQALMTRSEENGGVDGINIEQGQVRFFGSDLKDAQGNRLKVPHMGWSEVAQVGSHPLWANIANNSRFYFVHSFYIETEDRAAVQGICDYGVQLDAAIARDNLFAVQFHPEKSADTGLQLLKNFMHWNGSC